MQVWSQQWTVLTSKSWFGAYALSSGSPGVAITLPAEDLLPRILQSRADTPKYPPCSLMPLRHARLLVVCCAGADQDKWHVARLLACRRCTYEELASLSCCPCNGVISLISRRKHPKFPPAKRQCSCPF